MAKFYVQCGSRWVIIEAMDAEASALHWMDRVMRTHVWIYDDAGLSDQDRFNHLAIEALLNLSTAIRVSEQGLDRDDAIAFGTPEILQRWHGMMTSLNRLRISAGLPPRSLC